MHANVETLLNLINEMAPFETAEGFDNVGLLLGKRSQPVSKVLVTLDVTKETVGEAVRLGVDSIISHHPLLFRARKNITEEDPEGEILCELIRNRIALIAAHTNLDQTAWSGSACCAKRLELRNIRPEPPYLFLGELKENCSAKELQRELTKKLHYPVRCYGDENATIATLAIAGGSYDEGWEQAKRSGAQALLTGEVGYHTALTAIMSGFVLFDGGHFATEAPLIENLADYLQKRLDDVQYNVRFYPSESAPIGCV
ncbi:MAG: Nif3-like dinuclear metal center hexameric protein [Clostridiales bacterium]|nr:Nif3-like dinuclear metal center hexameric protein [Clostridiales bacterium]